MDPIPFPFMFIFMFLLLFTLASLIVRLLPMGLGAEAARRFEAELKVAEREHRFHFEHRPWRSQVARGRRGDYHVRVEIKASFAANFGAPVNERSHEHPCVTLACDRFPKRVAFSREGGQAADVLTGDGEFDHSVHVEGDPAILAALLDEPVRFRLLRLVAWGWNGGLRDGEISWETPFISGYLPRTLGQHLELADLLTAAKGGICERLARNAREDMSSGVRLWNLTLLQHHFDGRSETKEASHALLADPSPWVRLAAARFLPDEGSPVLRALLEEGKTPDHAAAEAAALLGARLRIAEAGPLLIATLKKWSGETRRQAIQELGRLKHAPAVGPLCVLLDRSDPRAAADAADALRTIGDPKAAPRLLDAVRQDAAELRIAAARALGLVGTVQTVEPLLELIDAKIDGESRQALREAVSAIQARLAGAEAGQVSLAVTAAEAGRLSLATPRAGPGDVSLATGPDRAGGESRRAGTATPEGRGRS